MSTAGYKLKPHDGKKPTKAALSFNMVHGTPVVNTMLVARQQRSHLIELTNPMKVNTTTNLASVVMLVILSPFLALAILVSIKTAGIRNNEVLLLLLTLSSAVLSGINGFGRHTVTAVQLSTAKARSGGVRPSTASISFADLSK